MPVLAAGAQIVHAGNGAGSHSRRRLRAVMGGARQFPEIGSRETRAAAIPFDRSIIRTYNLDMTVARQVRRLGGSLGILIPRDTAAAMNVKAGSAVRLTLVGRQLVVEPTDDTPDDGAFRRALRAVLRRHSSAFEALAAFDRGALKSRRR